MFFNPLFDKYYVEIDYEPVYSFDGIAGDMCHYTLSHSYEERMTHLDSEIVYRVFTPTRTTDIADLRRALSRANKLFVTTDEGGSLVVYNEDDTLGSDGPANSLELVNACSNKNILHLFEMGIVGKFSKEKTTTLREFLSKYDFDVLPLDTVQQV